MLAVARVLLFEAVEVDEAGVGVAEKAEGDVVLGVGLCKEVVEDGPVVDVDAVSLATIGDGEENGVLLTLDFVLYRGQ